jgi:hypothetical protein
LAAWIVRLKYSFTSWDRVIAELLAVFALKMCSEGLFVGIAFFRNAVLNVVAARVFVRCDQSYE